MSDDSPGIALAQVMEERNAPMLATMTAQLAKGREWTFSGDSSENRPRQTHGDASEESAMGS